MIEHCADVIEFDQTLSHVQCWCFDGSFEHMEHLGIIEGSEENTWFFLKGGCFYDITLGDYIVVTCRSQERFLIKPEKLKKIMKTRPRMDTGTFLVSRLDL